VRGCKQGDGALPAKTTMSQSLGDLQRDLAAVVGGEQQAIQDLSDDLLVFTDEPKGRRHQGLGDDACHDAGQAAGE
jgi:hypothetical protein